MTTKTGVSTKTEIEALEPKATNYPVPVILKRGAGVRGLAVQVTPAGCKSFVLRFRLNGKQKTLTIGRFPDMGVEQAVSLAQAKWSEIREGHNPSDKTREDRKALTVKDLADRYILEHIPGNSESWGTEATRLINKHILPALGKLTLADVGPSEISGLLYKMKLTTPTQANRVRAVLRTMFGRAEEWEYRTLGSNPVAVVKQRATETKRERRLTDMELKALGAALQKSQEAPTLLLAVRLALLAGMRKGEIAGLQWGWVDVETGEIRIPPEAHKTGKKTGKPRFVHLCSSLAMALKATAPTLGCPFVVPGKPSKDEGGKVVWGPFIGLQGPWERIRDAAGLAPKDEEGEYTDEDMNPGWHDLRRTFASVGADLGLKGFVGELLGHAEATVTDIYTRSAAEPLHEAAEKIGARIDGILSGKIDPEKEAQERREAKEAKAKKAGGVA
jgi:integrase